MYIVSERSQSEKGMYYMIPKTGQDTLEKAEPRIE